MPQYGVRAIRVDLEGLQRDPVEQLASALEAELRARGLLHATPEILSRVESAEILGVGASLRPVTADGAWERIERSLRASLGSLNANERLVVGLDEVPWWLDEIEAGHPGGARAALAALRRLRQARGLADSVRFILTGSIGLAGLASALGASAELNDLATVLVNPLTSAEGQTLFETEVLARGGMVAEGAARTAAELAGGVPHWIKELASRVPPIREVLPHHVTRAAEDLLQPMLRKTFADEGSEHFRRRHPGRLRALHAILDLTAEASAPVAEEAAMTAAMAAQVDLSRADARECIHLLVGGFYLRIVPGGKGLEWAIPLFRLWWLRCGGM